MLINVRTELFTVIHSLVLLRPVSRLLDARHQESAEAASKPLQGKLALLVALCILPLKTDGGTLKKYSP